jgi:hypothetical protein
VTMAALKRARVPDKEWQRAFDANQDEKKRLLEMRVWKLALDGRPAELRALLREHPEVTVDSHGEEMDGLPDRKALECACSNGNTECAQLLIDHKADANYRDAEGYGILFGTNVLTHLGCVKLLVQNGADVGSSGIQPALMECTWVYTLDSAQYLLEHKADIHFRIHEEGVYKDEDVLCYAMQPISDASIAFAFLSCNTDAKNVKLTARLAITAAVRDTHIETYKNVQAYIDAYHRVLKRVLSEHVQVDRRIGLNHNGVYQEPLERVMEYLGLSMNEDQVVNTSIDGEAVRRALIPGHLPNANHWFDKSCKETQRAQLQAKKKKIEEEYKKKLAGVQAQIDAAFA